MGVVLSDEVCRSSGFHGFLYERVILRGDSNDVYAWKKTLDSPSCLDSTYPRHFHVHNNDVRSASKGQLNGCLPVCGLTDDYHGFVG